MRGAANLRLLIFLAVATGLAILLVVYSVTHRRPLIPADADHFSAAAPERCLQCHGPGMKNARGKNHPLNDRCFDCHERA